VRKWRARWLLTRDIRGLEDADRPGRPARISVAVKCELVEMACDREKGVAFREVWTQQSLADALLVRRGISVSRSTVQRTLHARGMRPHRIRQWLHSPDPEFRRKVQRVCELYLEPPPGSIVLCIDEKPMQPLFRRFPTRTSMIDGSPAASSSTCGMAPARFSQRWRSAAAASSDMSSGAGPQMRW